MDFRQLQYMLKVAEERSFSKAAKKLYIAQPSLSQYIIKLEQDLGVKLFDRTTSPLGLTFAGELYVATAKNILDLKDQLLRQMEDIADLKKGRLTIGTSSFRSAYVLPSILPLFHEKFPGIEVVLAEGSMSELEELTIKGATDLSIMTLPIQENLFSYEPILTEEILIALPPHHPLREKMGDANYHQYPRPIIHLSELKDEPFILLKQGQRLRQVTVDLCKQAGFKPRIVLESKSIETAHALVAAGVGITFIPDTLSWDSKLSECPLYCSMEGVVPTRTLVVAYRKGRYLSKAAQEFITLTKEILGTSTK